MAELPPPEFSRPVAADRIGATGLTLELEATAEECRALAERFRILAVDSLTATVSLRRLAGSGLIRLQGRLAAQVRQACVVTLEPVAQQVEEQFEMLFGEGESGDDLDVAVCYDEEDPPEPMLNGRIDVGEAVAEHLALGLDPFPRAAGAVFDPEVTPADPPDPPPNPNPFAALAALRRKDA